MNLPEMLKSLKRRVDNLVARAVVQVVRDSAKLQSVQISVLEDETRDQCERFQQYGLTGVPLPGAEAVVLFVGGLRDHPLITNIDDRRYRPTSLQPGEVCLYTDQGDTVHIKRGGTIEVTASTKVLVTAPLVQVTGDVDAGGVFLVDGTRVVTNRQAAVTAPTGGATIDSQARTAINAIRDVLTAHGLTG